MPPAIEVLAEAAYQAFLLSLGEYSPPGAKAFRDLPQVIQNAWKSATQIVLVKCRET